jgi:Ras-related protein Rab-6A
MTEVLDQSSYAMVRQKLVFVGDVAVGKTSIINCLIGHKFKDTYEPSVGVDFFSKTIKFKGKTLKLQMWDSAGQEKYKSLIPNYIRGSAIIFVIYDVTSNYLIILILDKKTFENIPTWINFINNIENTAIVICGNKIDLNEDRYIIFKFLILILI